MVASVALFIRIDADLKPYATSASTSHNTSVGFSGVWYVIVTLSSFILSPTLSLLHGLSPPEACVVGRLEACFSILVTAGVDKHVDHACRAAAGRRPEDVPGGRRVGAAAAFVVPNTCRLAPV